MYVSHNIEARSRNHCCRGKAISITYLSVCVLARARRCVCCEMARFIQQSSQCTYKVTLRLFLINIVDVEKK